MYLYNLCFVVVLFWGGFFGGGGVWGGFVVLNALNKPDATIINN